MVSSFLWAAIGIIARLTLEAWMSMAIEIHMVFSSLFCPEFVVARLAGPVADGVHMLAGSMIVHKGARAYLALGHCDGRCVELSAMRRVNKLVRKLM
jgi:hypothetical protein